MSLASEPAARQGFRAADLAFVGSGAAFLVVCSLVAIPIGPAGAPITLQTFAVLLLGAVLGSRRGALAVLLYLAVGFAGLAHLDPRAADVSGSRPARRRALPAAG